MRPYFKAFPNILFGQNCLNGLGKGLADCLYVNYQPIMERQIRKVKVKVNVKVRVLSIDPKLVLTTSQPLVYQLKSISQSHFSAASSMTLCASIYVFACECVWMYNSV